MQFVTLLHHLIFELVKFGSTLTGPISLFLSMDVIDFALFVCMHFLTATAALFIAIHSSDSANRLIFIKAANLRSQVLVLIREFQMGFFDKVVLKYIDV